MNAATPPGPSDDPRLLAFRREQRRLVWLGRALLLVSAGFIALVLWSVIVVELRDVFFILPSVFGSLTGLSRYLVFRVRTLPAPVTDLRHPDPAVRDRAWALVHAHRAELLGATDLPATIHEPPLLELSRDALVERVARVGATNWRRVLRIWLIIWTPLAIAILAATLLRSLG